MALLIVVYVIGIFAILCLTYVRSERLRVLASANIRIAYEAEVAAGSAARLLLARLSSPSSQSAIASRFAFNGTPWFCTLDKDTLVAVAIEDEGGKVDLNGASPALLSAALQGFGLSRGEAEVAAANISVFRGSTTMQAVASANGNWSQAPPPKVAPFQTVFELDQVAGIRPEMFKRVVPFVTVSTGSSGIDASVAPPALLAALAGRAPAEVDTLIRQPYPNMLLRNDPNFPVAFLRPSTRAMLLIHAEVRTPRGALRGTDLLIDLRRGSPLSAIKEVRTGRVLYLREADSSAAGNWPDCSN